MKTKRFQLSFTFAALLFCVVAFQNCSALFQSPKDFFTHGPIGPEPSQHSTGNGDTYDGKPEPGTYYRVIPDQRCGNDRVIHSFINVSKTSMKLDSLDPSTCTRKEETLSPQQLTGSNLNRSVLGFAGGVFEKMERAPDLASRSFMTPEVWCRSTGQAAEPRFEVLVKVAPSDERTEARLFYERVGTDGVRTVSASPILQGQRTVSARNLSYTAREFNLDVDLSSDPRTPTTARLQTTVENRSVDMILSCDLAGRLDPQNPVAPLTCPSGYLTVPPLAGYTQSTFCISKYESSRNGSRPASIGGALPWVNISRDEAISACQALGPSYDLISNNEWQTTARDIELVPDNWSGSVVASAGGLSRGHSDNVPGVTLASSLNDDESCIGTQQTCDSTVWNSQRRTFRLSTGSLIWDLAGNADEWIKDDILETFGPYAPVSQVRTSVFDPRAATLFGPTLDYSSFTTAPYAGLGDLHVDFVGGAARRGGGWEWSGQDYGGLFKVYLYNDATVRTPSISFRCVYHP